MKKSVEIIGLPVISITEGRELGMSKSLLIDAPNGSVAAITLRTRIGTEALSCCHTPL